MRTRLVALVAATVLAGHALPAWGQIEETDPLEDVTDEVTEAVEETVGTVAGSTGSLTQTVDETGSSANDPVGGSGVGGFPAPTGGAEGTSVAEGSGSAGRQANTGARGSSRHGVATRSPSERQHIPLAPSWQSPIRPLSVVKTNDADGDGAFTDTETAQSPGAAVSFRVEITNTTGQEITLIRVRDGFEEDGAKVSLPVCLLAGEQIQAGRSTTCTFTLEDYAPEEGRKVNLLTVVAVETADSSISLFGGDASVVAAPDVGVLGGVKFNPLATTGSPIGWLLRIALSLLAAGALLVEGGRLRATTPSGGSIPGMP